MCCRGLAILLTDNMWFKGKNLRLTLSGLAAWFLITSYGKRIRLYAVLSDSSHRQQRNLRHRQRPLPATTAECNFPLDRSTAYYWGFDREKQADFSPAGRFPIGPEAGGALLQCQPPYSHTVPAVGAPRLPL